MIVLGNGEWRVEYQDDDGGCYVTIFAGPAAERRARIYFEPLKTGHIATIRSGPLGRGRSAYNRGRPAAGAVCSA